MADHGGPEWRERETPRAARDRITFLGHATVLVELDGLRLLTDPVLRQQVGPLWRRTPMPHLGSLSGLDAVLISHLHLDHYDPASLRLLDKGVPIVGPPGSARSLRWRGFMDIHELGPGERLRLGSVEITATEAQHPRGRHPLSPRAPSVGYVISGSQDIYFAGDTGLFPGMADLWSGLDVALLPIAGLGPWLPEIKHLSPRHAVRAMELLRPNLVIPIHWGTYHLPGTTLMRMRPDIHRRAPLMFMREAADLQPEIRTVMLEPGKALDLEPSVSSSLRRAHLRASVAPVSRGSVDDLPGDGLVDLVPRPSLETEVPHDRRQDGDEAELAEHHLDHGHRAHIDRLHAAPMRSTRRP